MSLLDLGLSGWSSRVLDALVASRVISEEQGRHVLDLAAAEHRHVATVLEQEGLAEAESAMRCLSAISGLPVVDLIANPPTAEAGSRVPAELARRHGAVGYRLHGARLTIACVEPPDAETIRSIAAVAGAQIDECILALPAQLETFIGALSGGVQVSPTAIPEQNLAPARVTTAHLPPPGVAPPGSEAPGSPSGYAPVAAPAGTGAAVPGAASAVSAPLGATGPGVSPNSWSAVHRPSGPYDDGVLDINELLADAVAVGASDLHLADRFPPAIRVDGAIRAMEGKPHLEAEQLRRMVFDILPQQQRDRFEEMKELDTAHTIPGLGRFRVSVFRQRGSVGAVLRTIPDEIPPLDSLGLPPALVQLTDLRKGLVLVTGPTGSGKSTTLAAMVDVINQNKPLHIMTVEDPIEYLHTHGKSIVNQREVGQDTSSFSECLRHVLRQDPDVILVGEMRDLETISTALTAAETGHLVFATLHTQDAPQSIDRVIDAFPPNQQEQVRIQLAGALEAIVTQQLVLAAGGVGRVAVAEVMICTPGIRNLIRSAKTHQVYSLMQTGGAAGMQTMDQALADAVRDHRITESMALDRSRDPSQLMDYLRTGRGRSA